MSGSPSETFAEAACHCVCVCRGAMSLSTAVAKLRLQSVKEEIGRLTLLALRRMRQQAFQMRPPETRPAWVWAVLHACCTKCEQLRTM